MSARVQYIDPIHIAEREHKVSQYADPVLREALLKQRRDKWAADPEFRDRNRIYNRDHKYSLPTGWFEETLEAQGYACAICGSPDWGARGVPCIDHDHQTGKPRALLCHHCNIGIGMFSDSPELLLEAVAYLRTA